MTNPVIAFFKTHKLAVAVVSLLGSIAGVVFSSVDLHDTLKKIRRK